MSEDPAPIPPATASYGDRDEWMRKTGPLFPGLVALRQLTTLPMPAGLQATGGDTGRAAPWYPVIGALVGCLLAILAVVIDATDLVPAITGLAVCAAAIAVSGAMHETGFARTVDAITGEAAAGRSLGLPGLLALLAAVAGRAVLLLGIDPSAWPGALITSQIALRWAPVFVAAIGDRIGEPGPDDPMPRLTVMTRKTSPALLAVGSAFAAVAALIFGGWIVLLAFLGAAAVAFLAGLFLERRFSGLDAPGLAAVGLLCELLVLLCFAFADPASSSAWAR